MEEWISMIAQYGFPIVMCIWFMARFEKIIKANTDSTNSLIDLIKLKLMKK